MKRADLDRFVDDLEGPLDDFLRSSRVRLAVLINESGQVLAQRGFARAVDVIGVASLGAGIHASSRALARLLGQEGFAHAHQGHDDSQIFIGPFQTPAEELILIAVFGRDSSIGLVQVFFAAFVERVGSLEGWSVARPTSDAAEFERDLAAGLDRFFGSG